MRTLDLVVSRYNCVFWILNSCVGKAIDIQNNAGKNSRNLNLSKRTILSRLSKVSQPC